ncbi:hypothetical protein BC749_101893 [Flavobacterium araucananum]|uniref:Uncharacterized protein n=1 Tax=Flavobacterium araucananum TaxID=946678 RepID=A0A227PHQ1_9FLAO|nr:hypothetical protein [Flavobacterium araucananum]OXG09430.1 hypothetical protein B0A64_01345 [Flavobacterium araucananum]PWK02815.1 hypothetical protein BC749_101893 [Flavobacterium araucananum]
MKKLLLVVVLILGFNLNAQIVRHSEDSKPDEVISVNMGTTKINRFGELYSLNMPDVTTKNDVRWSYVLKKSEMIEIYNEVFRVMNSAEYKKGESFDYKNWKGDIVTIRYDKMLGVKSVYFVKKQNESVTHIGGPLTLKNLQKLFSIEDTQKDG